jgi:hypothetical protein
MAFSSFTKRIAAAAQPSVSAKGFSKKKGLKSMSKGQLHEFAHKTVRKTLAKAKPLMKAASDSDSDYC